MKSDIYTKETVLTADFSDRGFPPFRAGDTIRVAERIKEGSKERIQYFEGDVIAVSSNGAASTFTVRRIASNSISVEKIFPYASPKIEEIKFIREGDVRRAKLYYMRDRIGKKARVSEKIRTSDQKAKLRKRLAGTVVEKVAEESQKAPEAAASQEDQGSAQE